MKYTEFHRQITRQGWEFVRQSGSHIVYRKGDKTAIVPFHGSKEIGEGLRKKLVKIMGLE